MQLEKSVKGARKTFGPTVKNSILPNRWYDIQIVITGALIQCYLDGALMIDATDAKEPVYLAPTVDGKIMRDPSICLAKDGVYHCIWTSSWGSAGLGHATSQDLVHWGAQEFIPVMSTVPHTAMCWAPEIFYDDLQNRYMIFWSSGVNRVCSCWYVTTSDFKTYSAPKILFTSGNGSYGGQAGAQGAIDFYLFKDRPARYLLFYKKDDNSGTATVNYYRVAPTPEGPWGPEIGPIIPKGIGGEGPSVLKVGDEYRCYVDPQSSDFLFYYSSTDLLTWKQHITPLPFSHGTAIEISRDMALRLANKQPLNIGSKSK
jgi:beta-galactosidase